MMKSECHSKQKSLEAMMSRSSDPLLWHGIALGAIMVMGVLLYGHTLEVPFYLDDVANLRENLPRLESFSWSDLAETAFGGLLGRRPLANLSFALNAYFHDHHVQGYHAVNIAIHILNGMLLYCFVFKTLIVTGYHQKRTHLVFIASAASLLWLCHPVQIQAVTYIVQRMTSLATLFSIVALLTYIHGRLTLSRPTRYASFLCCFVSWVLAVASKEIAITIPFLIFFYEWFFFQNLDKTWLKRWAFPLLACIGILLLSAYWFYGYSPMTFLTVIDQPRGFSAFERLLTESRVLFIYISLLVLPHPSQLNLNHDITISRGLLDPISTAFSCLGLLVIMASVIVFARRHRLAVFCIIWFLAHLCLEAFAASIEPMFEHRLYLPSTLFFLPCVLIATRILKNRAVCAVFFVLCLVILSTWTYQRNTLWAQPIAFWKDAAQKSPQHFRSHFHLGTSYLNAGHYAQALVALRQALALDPPYPTEINTNIAISYYKMGDLEHAREQVEKALALNPKNYVALDLMGTLDREVGNFDAATRKYQRALALQNNFIQASQNLGLLYLDMGLYKHAVATFEKIIANHPATSLGYHGLGLTWARLGRYDAAMSLFEEATKRNPNDRDALYNLAITREHLKQYKLAADAYAKVLKLDPSDVETMHNLGMLHLNHLNGPKQGKLFLQKALSMNPQYGHAAVARQALRDSL
jgi:tetratricopeptide (TPR) repeat protein